MSLRSLYFPKLEGFGMALDYGAVAAAASAVVVAASCYELLLAAAGSANAGTALPP